MKKPHGIFKILLFFLLASLPLQSGCLRNEKIKRQENITLTQRDIKIKAPVTPYKINQEDISLPFYKSVIPKAGYKCVSTLPDGKTGYISRCEFYSRDTADDIAEWYKRQNMYIRYIDTPDCRKVIISDNKEMTVYQNQSKKNGSTLVMFRNEEKACTELIYTGFKILSAQNALTLNDEERGKREL